MKTRPGRISLTFVIVAAIAVLATFAGFWGYKMYLKGQRSIEVREEQGDSLLFSFSLHNENEAYFDWLIDRAHPAAFEAGYDMGGLFNQAEFNEADYNRALADEMLRIMRSADEPAHRELGARLDEHFKGMPALFLE